MRKSFLPCAVGLPKKILCRWGLRLTMGLTLNEELTRSLDGFREQLGAPAPNAAFGVFVDGRLRACSAVAWTSRFASSMHKVVLWGTFTDPSYRRKGLARMAIDAALSHARARAVRRVNLTVFLPNVAAITLYQSLGFTAYGVEPEAVCLDGTFYAGQQMSLLVSEVEACQSIGLSV